MILSTKVTVGEQDPHQREQKLIIAAIAGADGVLAPGSAHARPSAQPPIDTSEKFQLPASQKSFIFIYPMGPPDKPSLTYFNSKIGK